ncbi:MAG: hypothetical protein UIM24_06280 [Clostridia bacterium]|nr:hypothetical protein [Clostridia bacterium]
MQDIITDFYKRFTHEDGIAEKYSCPASVCIFGSGKNSCPEVGLRLSFGAEAAFRTRSDGRLVLSRSDSDTITSINKINFPVPNIADWAAEIINAIMRLSSKPEGIQMLLHTDVGIPELAPRVLCAVAAAAKLADTEMPLQSILRSAKYPAYYTAALLSKGRVSVSNIQTLDYLAYNLDLKGKKIITTKINTRRKRPDFPEIYNEHEKERISKATACLEMGYTDQLGLLMQDASQDMLRRHPDKKAEQLLNIILDYSPSVRILPDYSGAVVFVNDNNVDSFIMLVGDKYEKKAGTRPAFYISD